MAIIPVLSFVCFFRCPFLVFKLCNIFVDLPLFILPFFIYIRNFFLGGGFWFSPVVLATASYK
ncbi:Uncharacterized protein APZ42_016594 [Daphnia magna]|uniref:Uncharacterized protein n=1 Tax=Daphnia magna TaxID=35525 RepID=A0A165AHZ5_9CRUS|nr:Uncharacterized protein APZ42_016594 [Daphnia magna]